MDMRLYIFLLMDMRLCPIMKFQKTSFTEKERSEKHGKKDEGIQGIEDRQLLQLRQQGITDAQALGALDAGLRFQDR